MKYFQFPYFMPHIKGNFITAFEPYQAENQAGSAHRCHRLQDISTTEVQIEKYWLQFLLDIFLSFIHGISSKTHMNTT
jgi:hypothetical protein